MGWVDGGPEAAAPQGGSLHQSKQAFVCYLLAAVVPRHGNNKAARRPVQDDDDDAVCVARTGEAGKKLARAQVEK